MSDFTRKASKDRNELKANIEDLNKFLRKGNKGFASYYEPAGIITVTVYYERYMQETREKIAEFDLYINGEPVFVERSGWQLSVYDRKCDAEYAQRWLKAQSKPERGKHTQGWGD